MEREIRRQKTIETRQKRVQLSEAFEYLQNGATFLKYGRRGKPKPRHIFLIDKAISWREPGSSFMPETKKNKNAIRFMPLIEVDP